MGQIQSNFSELREQTQRLIGQIKPVSNLFKVFELMGNWKSVNIIRLADYINGFGFKPIHWTKEGLPIVRIEQLKNPDSKYDYCSIQIPEKNTIDYGDLIFSWSASLFLKIWDREKAALNQHLFKVIPNEETDKLFLKYLLEYNLEELTKAAHGSTMQHITRKELAQFKAYIPEDKPEQTRIAEILSTADETIAHTEALIAKYQRIKTGLMQDLLTKGIDEKGNIRSKATHKFVVKNGIEVPEEWEVVKLIDCVDKSTIITYGIVQTGLHVVDGVRVLRTVDLQKDKIESSNLLRTTEEISNSYKRTILKKFDLVCNVRASVGDFNIIDDDDLVGCNTTRGVARISPKKEINPYYLLWFLRSERNTKQMELLIKGTTFIDINIADLREIWIPIPNNKSEQDKIAEKLIQITDTLQDYNRQLLKLQSLKTGLMQDLLSGKVRVNINNKN